MTAKTDKNAIESEVLAFPDGFLSLILGTSDAEGLPLASYAPFVRGDSGCFWIYVSELAGHTGNLATNPKASILFIENEADSANLFARKRLTLTCEVLEIGRGKPEFDAILDRFSARHGAIMDVLRPLQDFHLFALQPFKASYVRGFAQAYELHGEALNDIRPRTDRGHR